MLVDAVRPAIGRPVQLVSVPLEGVPRAAPLKITCTPSTVIAPAPDLAIVVSVACPNSIVPTPKAVDVEATKPEIGRPVQLVKVPDDGVPSAGAT